jgi:alpha-1,2-glucosyltransferase
MSYASSCHGLINRFSNATSFRISPTTLHAAFNIALFPPVFFFSGLFYTDVLSTCLVLWVYKLFLQRENGVWLYVGGILALTMRQTNIFWVAIYMGGLEAVRSLQEIPPPPHKESSEPKTWKEVAVFAFNLYARGNIHDISLKDAEVHGMFRHALNFVGANWLDYALCAVSIAVAIICRPVLILSKLWPYFSLLVSFGAFVLWNGGVVLGIFPVSMLKPHEPFRMLEC